MAPARPAYWAHRLAGQHALPKRPGLAELLAACAERGIAVAFSETLVRPGYYLYDPIQDVAIIRLRADAGAEDLAHELYHDCIRDGRREHALHVQLEGEEGEARRFAHILCSGAWSDEPDEPAAPEPAAPWEAGYYARGLRELEERTGVAVPEEFLELRPATKAAADLALREAEREIRRRELAGR